MSAAMARAIVLALMTLACAPSAHAQMSIKTVAFGGATNLQSWVAQDRGFFAREHLAVGLGATKGSIVEVRDLMAGKYQIMSSAFDNTVAYMNGQGDEPVKNASDLVVFMGVHSGLNSLVSRPEITSAAQLRGKSVAVDALKTGYALVLYELLHRRGLEPFKDYTPVAIGSTSLRLQALETGKAEAAMLSAPEDARAAKSGYHILADSRELGPYQGSVFVTRRSWANSHPAEMSAYIRAIAGATDYIFAHKKDSIAILKTHIPRLTDAGAGALYADLTGPQGFDPRAAINMAGVRTVLALRQAFGEPRTPLGPPSRYIDESYYRRALASK